MNHSTHSPRWKERLGFSFHREYSPYLGRKRPYFYGRFCVAFSATWTKTRELFNEQELFEEAHGFSCENDEEICDQRLLALPLNEYPLENVDTSRREKHFSLFDNTIKPVNGLCPKCTGLYVHDYDDGRCVNCGYRWCGCDDPMEILKHGRGQARVNLSRPMTVQEEYDDDE